MKSEKTTISATLTITDMNGTVLFLKNMEERNGLFGTNLRLMGDALEAVGKSAGRAFYRYAKANTSF